MPASLVGRSLKERSANPVLFTSINQPFDGLVDRDLSVTTVEVRPWANQSVRGKFESLASIGWEYLRLRDRIRSLDALISFGGHSSVPIVVAAREFSIPIFLQEQNTLLGRANRLFVENAQYVFEGLPLEDEISTRSVLYGNPIRPQESSNDDWFSQEPLLVVVGGSQGSRNLSRTLARVAGDLLDAGWSIYYVQGVFGVDLMENEFADSKKFRQDEFNCQLNKVLPMVQGIWSRAGAGTLAEIAACNIPALLFPYEHAADHHQTANARWFRNIGPATIVKQAGSLSDEELLRETRRLSETEESYDVPWNRDLPAQHRIARRVLSYAQ